MPAHKPASPQQQLPTPPPQYWARLQARRRAADRHDAGLLVVQALEDALEADGRLDPEHDHVDLVAADPAGTWHARLVRGNAG